MCGIAGIAALPGGAPPDTAVVAGMCATLVHRGPDEQGLEVKDGVGLGMRRLSIIDLAGGSQPIANEDGRVRTVFNGEIYNFRELRAELTARGHRFATRCDTEVIVHAYEEWGAGFATRLNGMFAIALHDRARRRLLLVRDPLGVKPLYFAASAGEIVFGSEIKAVLASGRVGRELDVDALCEFMAWEYVPAPATLLRAVRKLEPGALVEVDLARGEWRETRYWDVPGDPEDPAPDEAAWVERVDALLGACVERQLVSDVPLGAFLSGGVDSSLIVAHMPAPHTFSIGFDDPSYNELRWARRVADHLGADHRDEVIKPDVVALFDRLMHHMDDPIGDFSIFPTYLVSRLAREHVTVVLSGDGGDELFGGYETYAAQGWARAWARLPGFVRSGLLEAAVRRLRPRPEKKGLVNKALRFVEGAAHPAALEHTRWRVFAGEALLDALLTPDARARATRPVHAHVLDLFARAGDREALNRGLYVDLKSYLSDDILVKVDRMSMATSLEARVPYLDPELVALAFRVPGRYKVARGRTKRLLKRVAERHVPADCVYRPKEGFSIPIKHWLGTEFRPLLQELLEPSALRAQGLFRPDVVQRLEREHLAGHANHSHLLWGLIVFQAWRARWLEA